MMWGRWVIVALFFGTDTACAAENVVCANEKDRAVVIAARIADEWPLRDPDTLSEYTRKLGAHLAQALKLARQVDWRLHVVRDRSANGFSVGAGYIYITDGALRFARDEAEFAAIIAHEMGHQLAGHFCNESPSDGGGMFAWIDGIDDFFLAASLAQKDMCVIKA